jgi:hypothetical protein
MKDTSILVLGSSGYLGKNFTNLCSSNKINISKMSLQDAPKININSFRTIIDFSMLRREALPWDKDSILQFEKQHEMLLENISANKQNYFRVSSIFDIRNFARIDEYTKLSKKISNNIFKVTPKSGAIFYSHAVYGGVSSSSFIDNGILKNEFINESIRDYIFVEELSRNLLEHILADSKSFRAFEIGTAKPYLSTEIRKFLLRDSESRLKTIDNNSEKYIDLNKSNLVCSANQPKIQGVSKILIDDHLSEYLVSFYSN